MWEMNLISGYIVVTDIGLFTLEIFVKIEKYLT